MKRLSPYRTLIIFFSITATLVSVVVIGTEFIKSLPNLSDLLFNVVGAFLGGTVVLFIEYFILQRKSPAKVFISYSMSDSDFVSKLSSDLRSAGFQVLTLNDVVMVGDNIQQKIIESIQKVDFFVVVVTKESLESDWVRSELETAEKHRKKLFPVLKDTVPLPSFMQSIQYADFTKEYDSGISALIKGLRANLPALQEQVSKEKSA